MASYVEVDHWPVLDGPLFIHNNVDSYLYDSHAAICSPANDDVTIGSQTAESWQCYEGRESMLNMKGFGVEQSDGVMYSVPVEQQVSGFLPTTVEEDYMSGWQIKTLYHAVNEGSPVAEMQTYAVQSPQVQKQGFIQRSWPATSEMEFDGAESDGAENLNGEDGNVMDLLTQLCDTVDGDMIINHAEMAALYPSLPQMSPEDVDSLLSSNSWSNSSISNSLYSFGIVIKPPGSPSSDCGSVSSSESSVVPHVEKKRRKKEQNKTAALRYRQKKRSEQGSVMTECEVLEKRNMELRTKVSEMMKEIAYLKGLIEEIDA